MPAQTQIFPVKDFSGGISDSLIPNAPNQYLEAENLIITDERGLRTRPGSDLLDSTNYELPSSGSRVNALIPFNDELFAVTGQYLYNLDSSWTEVTGPDSFPALSLGDEDGYVSFASWRDHLFVVNDQGAKMVKIYRDEDNALQLRTAGLPSLAGENNWNDAAVLSAAIAKANEFKDLFSQHFGDFGGTASDVHDAEDTDSDGEISGVANATEEASLYTLVKALMDAYQSHVNDAQKTKAERTYHTGASPAITGVLNVDLKTTVKPTTVEEAAEALNDIHQKYYWHIHAPGTHNQPGVYGRYAPTLSKITLTSGVVVSPYRDTYYDAVEQLRTVYNDHLDNDDNIHVQDDTSNNISSDIPAATDDDSFYLVLSHLRYFYTLHRFDATYTQLPLGGLGVGDSNSSVTLTNCEDADGNAYPADASDYADIVGKNVYHPDVPVGTTVSGSFSSAGTITLSASATATNSDQILRMSDADYHGGHESNADAALTGDENVDPPYVSGSSVEPVDVKHILPATLEFSDWAAALQDLRDSFLAHVGDVNLYADFADATEVPHRLGSTISEVFENSAPESLFTTFQDIETASYLYAFHYSYEYSVGDVTFLDVGPVLTLGPLVGVGVSPSGGSLASEGTHGQTFVESSWSVTDIPALTNSVSDHYDTATVKVEIYRTESNGSTFYKTGEVTNGTTSFTDDTPDTSTREKEPGGYGGDPEEPLISQQRLYTSGGIVENDPPPPCKQIMLFEDTLYYGGITDGADFLPKRILQSVPGDPDSVPRTLFTDLDEDFVAFGKTQNNRLAFSGEAGYRLNGLFDSLGRGSLTAEKFDDTVGCISRTGVVNAQGAVFYPGPDGFYRTNGFENQKISSQFEDRYLQLTETAAQKDAIIGHYNPEKNLIWWTMQTSPSAENHGDFVFVLNLRYGTPFTYFTSGENFQITSLAFWENETIRGDARGYIFRHSDDYRTDPKVDVDTTPTSWGTSTIRWNYLSPASDYGNSQARKWANRWTGKFRDRGNLALDIVSINDAGRVTSSLRPILFEDEFVWGNPSFTWGDSTFKWNPTKFIDQWRRFPSGSLRHNYKQIRLTNAFTEIAKSDTRGTGDRSVTSASQFTVDLNAIGDYVWPAQPHEYFIYFEDDSYVQGYEIIARNSDTQITCSDADGNNPGADADVKWVIRGYPKNDRMYLLEYGVHYYFMGRSQKDWSGASTEGVGENA